MSYGNNIRRIRIERGLSQEELAQAVGVTGSAISRWESGQRQPNIEKLKKLSAALGVTVDELLQDRGEEK